MNKNGTIDQDTQYYTVVSETYLSMHGVTKEQNINQH